MSYLCCVMWCVDVLCADVVLFLSQFVVLLEQVLVFGLQMFAEVQAVSNELPDDFRGLRHGLQLHHTEPELREREININNGKIFSVLAPVEKSFSNISLNIILPKILSSEFCQSKMLLLLWKRKQWQQSSAVVAHFP